VEVFLKTTEANTKPDLTKLMTKYGKWQKSIWRRFPIINTITVITILTRLLSKS
jgi:hypothetical protein